MARKNFKNIQVQGKIELAELFEDTYEQSGANSKAEFLGILLDNYLNPKESNSSPDKNLLSEKENLETANSELEQNMGSAKEEIDGLKTRLALYENDFLKGLLKKHKGKKLKFENLEGKEVTVTVNDLPDVYKAIINSINV